MTNKAVQIISDFSEKQIMFGKARTFEDAMTDRSMAHLLIRRLSEKSQNYDHAAAQLELRGDADSARVLRKAASKLRTLTRNGAAEGEDTL
jgi:hypothetical protein